MGEKTGETVQALAAPPAELPPFLTSVLESKAFEKAPTLRTLLRYLWQFRGEAISEYAVATGALRRSPLFNAKTDATVRVQISRLRQRLEKYYDQEGAACAQRLIIPLGSHQIRVETVTQLLAPPSLPPSFAAVEVVAKTNRSFLFLACGVVLILLCVLGFWVVARSRTLVAASPEAHVFGKSFSQGRGRPVSFCRLRCSFRFRGTVQRTR